MNQSEKWVVASLFCFAVTAVSGCQQANQMVPPQAALVTVAKPIERPVQEFFQTTGTLRAQARVDLRARVGGYLKEIHFNDGQTVEEGDLLFVIDPAPFEAIQASAKANLSKAQAQLRLAQQQLARTQSLAANAAATENSLDVQMAERDTRAAEVEAAEAALREADLNLNYTRIHAPFAGRMGRHQVDVGNLIAAGDTLLASLEAVDPIHAYFTLSEPMLLRFMEMQKKGEVLVSEQEPLLIELALGESEEFLFQGQLDFREFGIDSSTGTTQRRAVFSNEDGTLVPGLFVRVRAAVGQPRPKLLVQERAINSDQRGDYLLVVNDKNVVETRRVELGMLHNGMRVIESGVHENDAVIVNGLLSAFPGAEVKTQEVPMESDLDAIEAQPAAEEAPATEGSQPEKSSAESESQASLTPDLPSSRAEARVIRDSNSSL